MRPFFFLTLLLLFSKLLSAQDISGDWHGSLEVMGSKLPLVFHLEATDDGYTATLDSPDQLAFGIPVETVSYEAPDLSLKLPALKAEYRGTYREADQFFDGVFEQSGMSFPLELRREAAEAATPQRPQHPTPPFPYRVEQLTFDHEAAGITLAGTLTLPAGKGPFPAAVLISGSGPQNRNEELMGHKPFLVIADYLTRRGIAVLRYDDRGVGASGGDFAGATSQDFAGDARAAVDFLKERPEIASDKIGLIGHSEGGLIAPLVAARSPNAIAFLVLLAGPGVRGDQIILRQQSLIAEADGRSEEVIQLNQEFLREAFKLMSAGNNEVEAKANLAPLLKQVLQASSPNGETPSPDQVAQQLDALFSPWFRHFATYDPAPTLAEVRCPVLALNGAKDLQVDPGQNLPAIETALKEGGNPDFSVQSLPGLNHLFQHAATGSPSEYARIEETFAPEALELITAWISERAN